ncbi:V-type ATP synthase subunit F [Sulfuracidifex tepidarius]|uniref:V-type ATP synthase subunit F n=1 Tax=Sulfuracidifex tepidarius TaxID=1294262 RepID=A0A510DUZ4_9CREN|nr:V-type ATP synthase subunit F [Sulfuracidifex tepidarius]BBG23984.1 V-type ATP synthase subunit F [Sulfuracidifex tepidarius]BBG26739.1 V-type ATP synthase subunit F [Sulfuracidifex tepidarius]
MGKVVLVGDKYTVNLFKMMGAEGTIVEDPLALPQIINEVKKRQDVDLVLITKDIYNPVRESVDSIILNQKKPLITIIPSPFSEAEALDVKRMIMAALGFG